MTETEGVDDPMGLAEGVEDPMREAEGVDDPNGVEEPTE
jgi:hypothetical protein